MKTSKVVFFCICFALVFPSCNYLDKKMAPTIAARVDEGVKNTISAFTAVPSNTPYKTLTAYPTYTVPPTYTPIIKIVTVTFTPTPENTPTKTLIPTKTNTKAPSRTPEPKYISLLGHMYSGVKVYYGPQKNYVFEIVAWAEKCAIAPSGEAVGVRYPDGSEEWKDRDYLVLSTDYYVREDDPNINSMDIDIYSNCY